MFLTLNTANQLVKKISGTKQKLLKVILTTIFFSIFCENLSPAPPVTTTVEERTTCGLLLSGDTSCGKHICNSNHTITKATNFFNLFALVNDTCRMAAELYHILDAYYNLAEPDSILSREKMILRFSESLPNDSISAKLLNILGNTLMDRSEYTEAMNCFLKARAICDSTKNARLLATVLNNLGILFFNIGDYDQAIFFYNRALKQFERQKEICKSAVVKFNLANCYEKKQNYKNSYWYLNQAISLFRSLNDTNKIIPALNSRGNIKTGFGNQKSAITDFNESIRLSKQSGNTTFIGSAYYNLSGIYFEQGETAWTEKYLDSSRIIFEHTRNSRGLMYVYEGYYRVERKKCNWGKALLFYEKHTELKDSILGSDVKKEIANLNAKFEILKTMKNASLVQEQLKLKKNENLLLSVALVATVLITLLIGGFIRLSYQNLKKSEKIKTIENDQLREKSKTEEYINRLERQKLQIEVEEKNKSMVAVSLQLVSKNETLLELLDFMKQEEKPVQNENGFYSALTSIIKRNLSQEKDWVQFKEVFESVNSCFFKSLKERCHTLTENELRHCAYIKINLGTKEIAQLFNVTPDSVKTSRYRIRKKLQLDNQLKLDDFIHAL